MDPQIFHINCKLVLIIHYLQLNFKVGAQPKSCSNQSESDWHGLNLIKLDLSWLKPKTSHGSNITQPDIDPTWAQPDLTKLDLSLTKSHSSWFGLGLTQPNMGRELIDNGFHLRWVKILHDLLWCENPELESGKSMAAWEIFC